uniref:Uncharacterized protein n=1 Tax=Globodera pallida TaxID=36090 RepID=A0A183C5C1_GLOPA
MKMMSDKMIDSKLHLDSQDQEIREDFQKNVEENCQKFENEEAKIIFLNNVHYELAINVECNQRNEIYERAYNLLLIYVDDYWIDLKYNADIINLAKKLKC